MRIHDGLLAAGVVAGMAMAGAAVAAQAAGGVTDAPLPGMERAVVLQAPDVAKFRAGDGKMDGGPYRYGVVVPVPRLSTAGKAHWWASGDDLVWRVRIVSPGAKSLDFGFSRFALPPGAEMRIASADGALVRGPFTAADRNPQGGFYSPYMAGDDVVVSIRVPRALRKDVHVVLDSATHAYRGLFEQAAYGAKSGSCNVDVACPAGDGWEDPIDSVGHYTFRQGSSSYVCTGTLVANTSGSTTPYFLTANHCLGSETEADTVVVYWNYQSDTCRTPGSSASGTPLSRSIATHSQSGAQLVASYSSSDFALLRLDQAVPAGAGAFWSGWDNRSLAPSAAVGIHHPAGHEKRIAVEDNALSISGYGGSSGTTHLRVVDWDQGTTEGGSSGSGLWSPEQRLVGQLHGGSAACGNNLSDYYGRLAVSWNGGGSASSRLRDWLDPAGSGATTHDGYRSGTEPPPPPPPEDDALADGVPVSGISGASGSTRYWTMEVPAGASNLSFAISGGSGDADLYVNYGSQPTTSSYDCRPYRSGNSETCNMAATAGTWHVMLRGYTSYSGVSLVGNYDAGGGGTQPSFFENTGNYTISDRATVESPVTVSGRSGNAPSTLTVDLRIIHTYRGDLVVNLVAPDGSTYLLHNGAGGSSDNLVGSYTVNASSEAANGTWKLRVYDRYNGDTGYIDSWSLQF